MADFETTRLTSDPDDPMICVVALTEKGLSRVLDGQIGMTFVVDHFTPTDGGSIAHVVDYHHNKQIWSLAADQYRVLFAFAL